jgi:hypothetical protein
MYSMKRTETPASCAIFANSGISSSLQPLVTTQFTFTLSNPTARASSSPSMTRQNMSFVPVMAS